MTPYATVDYAWIATRSKALLTTAERTKLTDMRGAFSRGPSHRGRHRRAARAVTSTTRTMEEQPR